VWCPLRGRSLTALPSPLRGSIAPARCPSRSFVPQSRCRPMQQSGRNSDRGALHLDVRRPDAAKRRQGQGSRKKAGQALPKKAASSRLLKACDGSATRSSRSLARWCGLCARPVVRRSGPRRTGQSRRPSRSNARAAIPRISPSPAAIRPTTRVSAWRVSSALGSPIAKSGPAALSIATTARFRRVGLMGWCHQSGFLLTAAAYPGWAVRTARNSGQIQQQRHH
jgi:hypothetical protein